MVLENQTELGSWSTFEPTVYCTRERLGTAVCNVLATSANRAPSACAKNGQQNMALYSVFGGHKRWLKSNQDC